MDTILVDTHYLIALINRFDQWHRSAIDIADQISNSNLIVTESVIVETLNFFAEFRSEVKEHAAETVEDFSANSQVRTIEQTTSLLKDGLQLYKSRLDKGYSLTDCISMKVCRDLGISKVLTNDKPFSSGRI